MLGGHTRLDPERSGLAALGLRFVEWAGYPAAVALYLLLPVAVAVVFRRVTPATEGTGWVLGLNLAVVFLFLLGALGVQVAAPGFADRHTAEARPNIELAFEERTTDDGRLLVIEHAGGDPAPPARLDVRGGGFADVEGADQTGLGPWAGEAAGRAPRHDGPAVVEGDTVVVVTDDCGLIVGEGPELRAPLDHYDCSESE